MDRGVLGNGQIMFVERNSGDCGCGEGVEEPGFFLGVKGFLFTWT